MIVLYLILLGLCFGSFVNAFVWRLRQQEVDKKLTRRQKQQLSVLRGRSMCVHCKHELAWHDLIPVFSWVSLGGKCRYCRRSISWQYPLVELLTAGLFVWSYLAWPYGFDSLASVLLFSVWLVFVVAFAALTVYDLRWMLLPNRIVYPLIGLALVQVVLRMVVGGDSLGVFIGALGGFVVIGGLFYVLFQVSDGRWIGGGDVKLAFMIGPLVGSAVDAFLVIFVASILGTLVSMPLLANKSLKASSKIPFGPFLLVATMIVYIYGNRLIHWYSQGLL